MKTNAEIIQLEGRFRAQNNADKEHGLFMLTDGDTDIHLLAKLYGAKYGCSDGIQWHPIASDVTSPKKLQILAARILLTLEGKKITQRSLAEFTGIPKSTIQNNIKGFKFELDGFLSPEILVGFRSEEEEEYRAISDQKIFLADYLCNYGKV